jgi:c(7)-type cytochrome triheme protein
LKALAILALCAGVAAADAPRATAIGFDHIFHDRNLVVKGGDALPCGRCHTEKQGKLVGKPTHASCFGACHGAAPTAPKKGSKIALGDRAKICTSCHAEAALAKPYPGKLAVFYPPYSIDPDFNITLGHKQHAATACVDCHDMRTGAGKPAAHQRCAGCHDGSRAKGPAMSACASCHPRAVGKPQPPELAAVRDTVTAVFSHAKHAARGATGKDCATCHAGVRATNDTELPRPTVKDCASCHDGKSAFATSTACTRCHDKPSAADALFACRRARRYRQETRVRVMSSAERQG